MFKSRNNGKLPSQIIIYRDGVSDSQFQSIVTSELPSIKGNTSLPCPVPLSFSLSFLSLFSRIYNCLYAIPHPHRLPRLELNI